MRDRHLDAGLVWFRRDLRDHDNPALWNALRQCRRVWCCFVYDREILDALPTRADRRVEFIHESVLELDAALAARGGGLLAVHAPAREALPRLAAALGVDAVFTNHDYEPQAVARDADVAAALEAAGRALRTTKDHAIFERDEVLSGSGRPYTVFTPYKNAWLKKADDFFLSSYPVEKHADALAPVPADWRGRYAAEGGQGAPEGMPGTPPPRATGSEDRAAGTVARRIPTLAAMGFARTNLVDLPLGTGMSGGAELFGVFADRIADYRQAREVPSLRGSSLLSVHLRFGTVSVRGLARAARDIGRGDARAADGASVWLSELVWRDFFFQVMHHLPHVVERACRPAFDAVRFDDRPDLLDAWKRGMTGYPLVDAGMRQLASTGFMHNRARMVTASFLVKHLGIDWRAGERHFADTLNDYELAANNGNWQWAASTGCDAQPWFRIFNPVTQSKKFDPDGLYIRRWVPELAGLPPAAIHAPWLAGADALVKAGVRLGPDNDYPLPVVDHEPARQRTLARYAVVKRTAGAGDPVREET